MILYQILQIDIVRIVWQTVGELLMGSWELKG